MRRTWEAFGRGDLAQVAEAFSRDVEFDVSRDVWGPLVGGGQYRGIEGLVTWFGDLYGAFEEFRMDAEEVIDAGADQVITVLYARGRGRTSGIEVEHHPGGVATVHGDKIVRLVWFPTRAAALEAAGLSE